MRWARPVVRAVRRLPVLLDARGQCRIDTASRWQIVAVAAKLDTGNNWDRYSGDLGGSAPDPFCEYENPAGQVSSTTAGVTDTLIDTYNPTWNQVITPPGATVSAATLMASSPAWQIWIGDDDNCSGTGVLRRGRLHDPPDDHARRNCAAVSSSSPTASSAIR